jgi:ABC-type phosphate transport system permease subunit
MIYILAVFLPPIALLLNGQPLSALLNLIIIIPCIVFGLVFWVLFFIPSIHAVIAIHMKRENRKHREIVEAIERHGPPPGFRP